MYLAAWRELLVNRGTNAEQWGSLLARTFPSRPDDFLASLQDANHTQTLLISRALQARYRESLIGFLTRWSLTEETGEHPAATTFLANALRTFDLLQSGRLDFPSHLYRQVLATRPHSASQWPDPEPTWLVRAREAGHTEIRWLHCCRGLSAEDHLALFLLFYAQLHIWQITCVLQGNQPNLTQGGVLAALRDLLPRVLERLTTPTE